MRIPNLLVLALGLGSGFMAARVGLPAQRAAPAPLPPVPEGLLETEERAIAIFRRASQSVVFITNLALVREGWFRMDAQQVPQGSGSGFVWDREGHIVTNFHVVQNASRLVVRLGDGTELEGKVIGFAPERDLAVVRVGDSDEPLVPLDAGASGTLLVGQNVYAIGNPFGLDHTLTTGVVSALGREIGANYGVRLRDMIQVDAAINPGNSGGPLLDSKGRLVGINTAILSPSGASAGIGFAVPIDTVKRYVPQLIEHGRIVRPIMGISLYREPIRGVRGVVVQQVEEDGPAHQAGLRGFAYDRNGRLVLGDVIVRIDDRDIQSTTDFYDALERYQPGEEVRVTYLRGNRRQTTRVHLAEPR